MNQSSIPQLLEKLTTLSSIDAKIASVIGEKKKLENELNTKLTLVKKLESEKATKQKAFEDKRFRCGREEDRVRDEREKLVARRKALTTLSNYKLQQSAGREIEHASKQIDASEESLLILMGEVDVLQTDLAKTNDSLALANSSLKSLEAEAKEASVAFETRLTDYTKEREALAKEIDPPSLSIYERIRERHAMDAVVLIDKQKGICGGCFMQVGAQSVVQVARGDTIVKCRGCGRILTLPPEK